MENFGCYRGLLFSVVSELMLGRLMVYFIVLRLLE